MIEFNNKEHGQALADYCGFLFHPLDTVISRVGDDGQLLGGMVYTRFTGVSVASHVGGMVPNWICNDLLWAGFHYPFIQLGALALFGEIRSGNSKSLEFARKLGYTEVVRIPEVYPGEDLVVVRMRRDECKWLRLKPRLIGPGKADVQRQG